MQNEVQCKQSEFLAHSNNKERFIPSLALVLPLCSICSEGADLTIIETALKTGNDGSHATVVVDILAVLLSKWRYELPDILVRHEAKRSIKKNLQIISIKETVSLLPQMEQV